MIKLFELRDDIKAKIFKRYYFDDAGNPIGMFKSYWTMKDLTVEPGNYLKLDVRKWAGNFVIIVLIEMKDTSDSCLRLTGNEACESAIALIDQLPLKDRLPAW